MDKDILKQYIDACEAVKETEEQIRQLQKNRKTVVVDAVKGSMHDFPFAAKNFKVAGIAHSVLEDPGQLDREEECERNLKILWVKIKSFSAFSVFSGFPMVKCKLKSLQMRCMIYSFPISSAAEVSELRR